VYTHNNAHRGSFVASFNRRRGQRAGFTLIEVLIALGLATVFLGVTLNAIARNTLTIAQASGRYQSSVWAGQALEIKMEQNSSSGNVTGPTEPGDSTIGVPFKANIALSDVIADPRVQAVSSEVGEDAGARRTVTGFRLKVKRSPTNTTSGTSSASTATAASSTGTSH
jgi:prepilin-type N-terminal cleavage/methylation domain-containing protein